MKIKIIFLVAVLAGILTTCKKYPEDDKFHLQTATSRIKRMWEPIFGNNFITNTGVVFSVSDVISFHDNGNLSGSLCFSYFNFSNVFTPANSCNFKSSWEFIEKKNKLKITDANGISGEYAIKKLDNDELWLQNDSVLLKFIRAPKDR